MVRRETEEDDCGWVDGLYVGPSSGSLPPDPEGLGAYSESLDSNLKFTSWGDSTWWTSSDFPYQYYHDGDAVQSGDADPNKQSVLQTIVDSDRSETVTFWWKVSCEWYTDFLRFYIDGTQEASITGDEDWQEESFAVSSGIHTLKWVYEDGGGNDGENCGWVDFVQWTGPSPAPDPNNWNQIEYKYDVYGRRSEKKVDGYATRYVYDGPQVIAEYDGNNNLLRKYIYGPGIDQPVCMIEVADGNAAYYYHYDAHGSVIALSDSTGDTVQTYEYSVFGEPAVEDPNHPNPYMFAGRRYDIEIGLYYNRARYYNPYTGRFLQTDPSGYSDGMNLYAYCRNNPLVYADPFGLAACPVCKDPAGSCKARQLLNDPCFTLATGRTMIMDAYFTPASLSAAINFSSYITLVKKYTDWKGTLGLALDIRNGNWYDIVKDKLDPCSYIVGKYYDFLEAVSKEIFEAGALKKGSLTGYYSPFIEIQAYKWKTDENGKWIWKDEEKGLHEIEKDGDPYWVRVEGLPGDVGMGKYDSRDLALDAAAKGVRFWSCSEKGHTWPEEWLTGAYKHLTPGYAGTDGRWKWQWSDPGTFGITNGPPQ